MIGNKLLKIPATIKEAQKIMLDFKMFQIGLHDDGLMHNATRLAELNNEAYEEYPKQWSIGYDSALTENEKSET